MRRASLHVAVLLSFGKLQLARHPLIVKLEPRAATLEPILCSGDPASGEWQELVCSEFCLPTQEHNDSHLELLRWRPSPSERKRATDSSCVLAVRAKVKTNPAQERGYSLRLNLRDVSDCLTQIIGTRVPEDWFNDLENESKDLLPISALKPWLISDLTDPPSKPSRAPGYVQVAIAGIMMGDKKNAVAALQNVQGRQLLSCGALTVKSLLLPRLTHASQSSATSMLMTLQCWQSSRRPTEPSPKTICA